MAFGFGWVYKVGTVRVPLDELMLCLPASPVVRQARRMIFLFGELLTGYSWTSALLSNWSVVVVLTNCYELTTLLATTGEATSQDKQDPKGSHLSQLS